MLLLVLLCMIFAFSKVGWTKVIHYPTSKKSDHREPVDSRTITSHMRPRKSENRLKSLDGGLHEQKDGHYRRLLLFSYTERTYG